MSTHTFIFKVKQVAEVKSGTFSPVFVLTDLIEAEYYKETFLWRK